MQKTEESEFEIMDKNDPVTAVVRTKKTSRTAWGKRPDGSFEHDAEIRQVFFVEKTLDSQVLITTLLFGRFSCKMSSTDNKFLIWNDLEAKLNGADFFTKTWEESIDRTFV